MLIKLEQASMVYPGEKKPVVHEINLEIKAGETVAVFGKSGSGKSTIGQIMAGILKPTSGNLFFHNQKLSVPFPENYRQKIQILFQHPEVSFNPRMTLLESMKEPYRFRNMEYTLQSLLENLKDFGIYEEHLKRKPEALSGGELQRLALARLMLMEPEFLVLDEPTSMLDVISQAQMIHILKKIQKEKKLGYLFISHDICLCRQFCHKIYHLETGTLTEENVGSFMR